MSGRHALSEGDIYLSATAVNSKALPKGLHMIVRYK